MGTSRQARVLPGAVASPYRASAAVVLGTIVDHDGANGTVSTATSGEGYGIAANDAEIGEEVSVVVFGPAYLTFGGTVNAGAAIVATTAGAGVAAGSAVESRIFCIPDAKALAGYVNNDLGFVVVGTPHTTP